MGSIIEHIELLKKQVEYYRYKSRTAVTKESKDQAIVDRHVLELELSYWRNKVKGFRVQADELTPSFKNSQLVDTRIITKYAFHYLKSVFNRVDVQKGSVTAVFRKILGIQSIDGNKDRYNLSHHAIDAAVLTMIPMDAKRDWMIELFYKIIEVGEKDDGTLRSALDKELSDCRIDKGIIPQLVSTIQDNILVEHQKHDHNLTPAKRTIRKQGKVIKDKYQTGDCIRGQLHDESLLGAVKVFKRDKAGHFVVDTEGKKVIDDRIIYVMRRPLDSFEDWDNLKKALEGISQKKTPKDPVMYNPDLYRRIREQFTNETKFSDALKEGIYMTDRNGNKVNRIRHLRCKSKYTNPEIIKHQTYLSDKDYKQYVYANSGDMYALCEYVGKDNAKIFKAYSLFDITKNRKGGQADIPQTILDEKGKDPFILTRQFKQNDMVLLYEKDISELMHMGTAELSKRLYSVCKFDHKTNTTLYKHTVMNGTAEYGKSIKDFNQLPEVILQKAKSLNMALADIDFEITVSGIKWISKPQ